MGNIPLSLRVSVADVDKEHITAPELLQLIHDKTYDSGIELKRALNKVDLNGDGSVSQDELVEVLEAFGFPEVRHDKLSAELYAILDKNNDGRVTINEMVKVVQSQNYTHASDAPPGAGNKLLLHPQLSNAELLLRIRNKLLFDDPKFRSLKQIYAAMDKNNDGVLTVEELKDGLTKLGFVCSDEVAKRIHACFDIDGNGAQYYEFARVLQNSDFGPRDGDSAPSGGNKKNAGSLGVAGLGGNAAGGGDDDENKEVKMRMSRAKGAGKTLTLKDTTAEEVLRLLRERLYDNGRRMKQIFANADTSRDGTLSVEEFTAAMAEYGMSVDAELAAAVFLVVDKDMDKAVSYSEFIRTVVSQDYGEGERAAHLLPDVLTNEEALLRIANRISTLQNMKDLSEVFYSLDVDNNGSVVESELKTSLERIGFKLSASMNRRLFCAFDRDRSGTLNYAEFVRVLSSTSFLDADVNQRPLPSRIL